MAFIQSVLGRISPDSIGFCQSHEHLLLSKGVSYEKSSVLLLDDLQKSLDEVIDYRNAGGDTIVEAQPVGCNREADGLVFISKLSGVKVIASTGFHKMIFYPEDHWVFSLSQDEICDIFIHEIQEGMYLNTEKSKPESFINAKAGQIKSALDTVGLNEQYKKMFLAAGKASVMTGAPMMVHIENGANPIMLVNFLEFNHVRPKKLIFCHMDRACADVNVHKEIASRGIFLEYDTIGRPKYHSDDKEIEIIKEMVAAGYEDMLLMSLDTTRARLKTYTPDGVGLTYILNSFIPMLKKAGLSETQIDKIMRLNPGRAFAFEK